MFRHQTAAENMPEISSLNIQTPDMNCKLFTNKPYTPKFPIMIMMVIYISDFDDDCHIML